jgi:ribulose kinase
MAAFNIWVLCHFSTGLYGHATSESLAKMFMVEMGAAMTRIFSEWLASKWQPGTDQKQLMQAYQVTFSTVQGQQVLQHLLDEVYCQTCPVHDPIALATHNGRRSVVHEMLENIDVAQNPKKYHLPKE